MLKSPYFLVLSTINYVKLFQTFSVNLLFGIKCYLLKCLLFSGYSFLRCAKIFKSLLSTLLRFKPKMLHVSVA